MSAVLEELALPEGYVQVAAPIAQHANVARTWGADSVRVTSTESMPARVGVQIISTEGLLIPNEFYGNSAVAKPIETPMVEKKTSEPVTWTALAIIVALAAGAVGVGFTWLHGDVADVKKDLGDVRSGITELNKYAASIDKNVAVTNSKLDQLIDQGKSQRK